MNLNEIMKMLKDPKALEEQANAAKARVSAISATGSAGGGMVKITLNGSMEILGVEISPEAVDPDDIPMLEDLVKAAFNDASSRVSETVKTELTKGMGPMGFPGL